MNYLLKIRKMKTYVICAVVFMVTVSTGCGNPTMEAADENTVTEREENEVTFERTVEKPVEDSIEEPIEEPVQEVYDYSEFFEHMEMQMQTLEQENRQTENRFDRHLAERAFDMVNEERTAAGLPELLWDEALYDTACIRAENIVKDFSHQGCPEHLGENIAANYRSIENLINAWMESEDHKENILDSRYLAAAMGCYICDGSCYWVQLFRF